MQKCIVLIIKKIKVLIAAMHVQSLTGMFLQMFRVDIDLIDASLEVVDRVLILTDLPTQISFLTLQFQDIHDGKLPTEEHIQQECKTQRSEPVSHSESKIYFDFLHRVKLHYERANILFLPDIRKF